MIRQVVLLLPALVLVMGCGGENDRGAHQAGQKVGETLTDFAKGVGKGVDTQLEVPFELNEEASNLGLQATAAKNSGLDKEGQKTIAIYIIASRPVTARLVARALNAEGDEIGRSAVDIELAADGAEYVSFAFQSEVDTQLVDKYVVGVGESVPKPSKPPAEDPADGSSDKEA